MKTPHDLTERTLADAWDAIQSFHRLEHGAAPA